jgi:N6-adenosine-specific RNA methylase IME4
MSTWEGLSPPYATIVADPPWPYPPLPSFTKGKHGGDRPERRGLPYSTMAIEAIAALPVEDLAANAAHLYLWTTNRYLRDAYGIVEAWGFSPSQLLTWCKEPMGLSVGTFTSTTEFVLFARRGSLRALQRLDTTWWLWKRGRHSVKPPAFLDLVERVSPAPRVELFARAQRLGWDSWGHGYEQLSPKEAAS